MKISLVGACELKHGYGGAAKALVQLGHQVDFIPAINYNLLYKKDHWKYILKDLEEQNPDIVLWWRAETLSSNELSSIKNKIKKPFLLYSWDDPLQWELHKEMPEKCKIIDYAFSCCMDSVKEYKKHGCKNAFYAPPGFDSDFHYPDYDEKYKCDVSMVCTNLYSTKITNFPHLNRKELLKCLIKDGVNVKIFGPSNFYSIFPDNYAGWIDFEESRKVFSSSKINISTHIRPDGSMYINERVSQILGCRGFLFVDHVKDLDKIIVNEKECIIMDMRGYDFISSQVKDILSNYQDYNTVMEGGFKFAEENLTWLSWAKIINNEVLN